MDKNLVIVESPAKAKTIGRFLGSKAKVLASMGHICDLPKGTLSVDVENNFAPTYELTVNGRKVIRNLSSVAKNSDKIYLATDPDREGEAIAWHLKKYLQGGTKADFYRISFHEITKTAIQNSFNSAGDIDINMVNAQLARRSLDRLIGYKVSPMLWNNIQKGTSGGRVQTVALRLIVEREREIRNFKADEYWNLDAIFKATNNSQIQMRLNRINGEKAVVSNQTEAESLTDALRDSSCSHVVSKVTSTPRQQHAAPPFITSTLQQAAGNNLKFSTSLTMKIAQDLYEGVEIGGNGETGLITYMRTDSVNISKEAQEAACKFIAATYGKEYVPARPNVYKSRNTAQEAHEAIRPTDVNRTPESLAPYLSAQQLKLYKLIWIRFVASQMSSANQVDHAIEVESTGKSLDKVVWNFEGKQTNVKTCTFRASYRETTFPGHLAVYNFSDVETPSLQNNERKLPELPEGTLCVLKELMTEQCFTNPPFRYSEAALVKALEQNGVGRPSTYASTVTTICDRKYVEKEKGSLVPTELGFKVCDYLVEKMPELFNIGFTAQMETELDGIEEGRVDWVKMLEKFYAEFCSWGGLMNLKQETSVSQDAAADILKLFPDDFPFAAPSVIGNRTFDDRKLAASLTKQISENKKPLSLRQRSALMNLAAKYAAEDQNMREELGKLGLEEKISLLIEDNNKRAIERKERKKSDLPEGMTELLEAMNGISWEAPLKRGTRTYDDGKFYGSICRCASRGEGLTEAQISAIKRLAQKYAKSIPGYDELAGKLDMQPLAQLQQPEAGAAKPADAAANPASNNGTDNGQAEMLLKLGASIKNWHAPASGGSRAFNDKTFYDSLTRQFKQKGQLSAKQLAALAKLLDKYSAEIPDYEEKLQGIGTIAKPAPRETGEFCPQCGAPLVMRSSRGKTFTACSAFPKCRFTK